MRIIDNRVQALAPSDPDDSESEVDWTDVGGETSLWKDRETAFQVGRSNGGLLVSADGIPGPHRMTAFHAALRSMRDADAEAVQAKADAAIVVGEASKASAYKPHSALQRAKPQGPHPAHQDKDGVPF
jgi:hypothetical protein